EIIAVKSKVNQIDNLGTMAWQNSVEKAMLGDTIIQGGYIKTELLNASAIVSNGGGATTSQLNNAINGVSIGGRNLAINSQQPIWNPNDVGLGSSVKMEDFSGRFVRITPNSDRAVDVYGFYNSNFQNGKFSRSMLFRHFHSNSVYIWGQEVPPNRWIRLKQEAYSNVNGWNGFSSNVIGVSIDVKEFMLVEGNKISDGWVPAPEDIEAQFANLQQGISNMQTSLSDVKTKTDNFTSIQGGLMMANLMSVGSNQANQN
ncbi:hypothetical protein OKE69_10955, partial [Riemerella anatipestifer]|nr:hypothetical protein [Riemerella anatipestifer]